MVKPIPKETCPARDAVDRAEIGAEDEDEGMTALRALRAEGLRPAWRRTEPRFRAHDTVAVPYRTGREARYLPVSTE